MMLQISRDYAGLPDLWALEFHEINWFYGALRDELMSVPNG